MYEEYAARLESRGPILKVLTRREQLKRRFDTTRHKAAVPDRLFTVDAAVLLSEVHAADPNSDAR